MNYVFVVVVGEVTRVLKVTNPWTKLIKAEYAKGAYGTFLFLNHIGPSLKFNTFVTLCYTSASIAKKVTEK